MGLVTLLTDLFSDSPPQLEFYAERCLRSRLNTNQCQKCLKSCPVEALSLDDRKIVIDAEQCTGCMSCVAACPQDALACTYDLGELLNSVQAGGEVLVSCIRQAQNHPDEIVIPCVGILSTQVLTALVLSGCPSIAFNLVGCTMCCNQNVSKSFQINLRQTTEKISDLRPAKVLLIEKKELLSKQIADRRTYLTKIRAAATDVSKKWLSFEAVSQSDTRKNIRRIPYKTQLVKQLLEILDGESQRIIIDIFGHNLSINEDCNCCPLCKGICPTGAITIGYSGLGKSLEFESQNCSGCGLCVEFCKKDALTLDRL